MSITKEKLAPFVNSDFSPADLEKLATVLNSSYAIGEDSDLTVASLSTTGNILSSGDVQANGNIIAGADIGATGDLSGVNVFAEGNIAADGNITGDTITATGGGFSGDLTGSFTGNIDGSDGTHNFAGSTVDFTGAAVSGLPTNALVKGDGLGTPDVARVAVGYASTAGGSGVAIGTLTSGGSPIFSTGFTSVQATCMDTAAPRVIVYNTAVGLDAVNFTVYKLDGSPAPDGEYITYTVVGT